MKQSTQKPATSDQKAQLMADFLKQIDGLTADQAQFWIEDRAINVRYPQLNAYVDLATGSQSGYEPSSLGYPTDFAVLPIEFQVHLLAQEYKLSPEPALACIERGLPEIPDFMENWGAYVLLSADRHKSYVKKLLRAAAWMNTVCGNGENREYVASTLELRGVSYREGHYEPAHLLRRLRTCQKRLNFEDQYVRSVGGKIIIAPMQWGKKRAGQTDDMVEADCHERDEFPLCAFDGCNQLAIHPKRNGASYGDSLESNFPGDVLTLEGQTKNGDPCHLAFPRQRIHISPKRKGDKIVPYMGCNGDGYSNARHGPLTACCWDVKYHMENAE